MIIVPSLIMILGGMAIPLLSKNLRDNVVLLLPVLALGFVWQVTPETEFSFIFAGYKVSPLFVHNFSHIFATIFCIASFAGGLFALNQARRTEIGAAYVYAGAAIGCTFAGDLISLFVYWEIMAIGSTVVIWAGRKRNTARAGLRYAYTHFFGGVILLAGICSYISYTGDASITNFMFSPSAPSFYESATDGRLSISTPDAIFWAQVLIMIGVLINAGAPPLSAWLPDAYPASSPFGAVFLSAFTTKTAVFVLLTMFPGQEVLIWIGLFMVFYGIIYAMLENNIRRILSYSIINQVGFMVVGIGIGTPLALAGVAAHAFCHIIYKALLFMSAGSVIYMTGFRRATDLGGLHHSMKLTTFCGIVGALSISAFPLTSGFVSKSLIADAAAYEHLTTVWFLLLTASAGVFLHAGIKFPWFVFYHRDSGLRPTDPPKNMQAAMLLLVAGCFIPAIFPSLFYELLPYGVNYVPYTTEHVVSYLQLLLFSGFAFFVALKYLKRTLTISLDFDWFYRVFAFKLLLKFERAFYFLSEVFEEVWNAIWPKISSSLHNIGGLEGTASKNRGLTATALATTVLLAITLIAYYL